MSLTPVVSVIIPVYNGEQYIRNCLDSIINQTYPENKIEIIVVDNGSTDNTVQIILSYPQVKIINEKKKGSYAARNKGTLNATGDILAFIDADCIADRMWLQNAVKILESSNQNMVIGGKVELFTEEQTPWSIFDKITFLNQEKNIESGSAVTANLIVPRDIFNKVGQFDSSLQSGGDVDWTKRCIRENYSILYKEEVKVFHPTRTSLRELSKKCYRVGYGSGQINRKLKRFYALIKPSVALPTLKKIVKFKVPRKSTGMFEDSVFIMKLIMGTFILQIINYFGKVKGYFNLKF